MAKEPVKMFKTKYDHHKRFTMNAGDRDVVIRKPRKVDGSLVVDDTKDLFPLHDYIQSFKDSVDIEVLLKRFKAGDQSVMQMFAKRSAEDYNDLTQIPDNIHEAVELMHKGETLFNELPAETKEKFDNNYEKFVAMTGSEEWLDKMGFNTNEENNIEAAGTAAAVEIKDPA